MSLMITSELSRTYFQEEDAVKGFKTAVDNNQVRLAMQILTEIIDAFVEGFEVILEAGEENEQPAVETAPAQEQPKQVEEQTEKKTSTKKTESKEEKTKDLDQ